MTMTRPTSMAAWRRATSLCGLASWLAVSPAAAQAPTKLTVFMTPSVNVGAVWLGVANGMFKAAGLHVQIRLFASGTTAFETFKTGQGDIAITGDLPALQYWQNGGSYRVIAPVERDAVGYIGVVRNGIDKPSDLAGKTMATRVGSTGSWFLSEYLTKNDITEAAVKVRNLDPPLMPVALCRGDIDGFFIWEPAPSKAKTICGDHVHYLTTAVGYVRGYNIAGARAEYLASPAGADAVKRFLRVLIQATDAATANLPEMITLLNQRLGLTPEEITAQTAIGERLVKFDQGFFDDFCSENRWQQRAGLRTGPSDLSQWIWKDGLDSIDPARVVPAPPPC